jgi:putative membrane protein
MITAHRWRLPHVMHYVGLPLLALFAWDVLIAVLFVVLGQEWVAMNELPMPLIGSALALLVTLRNSSAFARWWEARLLWGGVLNNSRTLARQVRLYLPMDDPAIRSVGSILVDLQVAYAQALRCHLRRQDPWAQIAHLVPPGLRDRLQGSSNVPDALLAEIADRLAKLHRDGVLDTIQLAAFDTTLAALGNLQGGTERIKNTPLSRQYTVFPKVFVQLFCLLLPLAMVRDLGLATPLGSTLVGFIFLALDQVGADLESPFENTIYDVPLTSITRTIEINLRQGMGHTDLPAPLEPVDGVLW